MDKEAAIAVKEHDKTYNVKKTSVFALVGSALARLTGHTVGSSNALDVAIVDGSGDQITSFGGGTQYTEGDTDASITGTATMWEDAGNTLVAASGAKPFPVEIIAGAGSGGTAAADDADFTAGTTSGTPAMGVYESSPTSVTDGDLGTVGITQARRLKTSATVDAALPAGTNAIGKLAANSGVDIGDVDILSIAAGDNNIGNVDIASIAAGDNNIGNVDVASSALPTGASTSAKQDTVIGHLDGVETLLGTIDADTSNLSVVGTGTEAAAIRVTIATDSTGVLSVDDNGASITVDNAGLTELAAAIDTEVQVDVVGALPAGTNAIGKLAANSGVDIGDVTLTAGTAAIGTILPPDIDITTHTNYAKKYYTSAGAATDGIIWSPAAGTRWHVQSIYIQVSAAATVTLEDDKSGGDEAIFKSEFAANGGAFLVFPPHYPLASGEDAADLTITTTAGNVYVTVTGYEK